MSKQPRAVWQITGGATGNNYVDILIKHGVALLDCGDSGPWSPDRKDHDFGVGLVRRFAAEVQEGDVFLLRTGTSTIHAIGIVSGSYQYLNQFDDVNGLDLQHARRVRWCRLPEPYIFKDNVFGAYSPWLSRTQDTEVLDYVERFLKSPPTYWQTAALPGLPSEEPPLKDVPVAVKEIIATINDLMPVFSNIDLFGENPSEDELMTHFVVPFFRKLGWPPELIGIKWRYIDIAIFDKLPRKPANCRFVVEVKRLGIGVESAFGQAKGYAEKLGCSSDIIVTDGIRYRLYSGKDDYKSLAYANLMRLKKPASYLFDCIMRKLGG